MTKKNPTECDLIRVQISEAKTRVEAEKARIRQEKADRVAAARAELQAKKEARKAAKEEAQAAKKEAAGKKAESVAAKRKEAQALRAKKQALKVEQQKTAAQEKEAARKERLRLEEERKAAKKASDEEKSAKKKDLKEQLAEKKKQRKETEAARAAQLKADKAALKAQEDLLNEDKQKILARRKHNEEIKAAVDKYKKELAAKITPAKQARIQQLVGLIKSGIAPKESVYELGKELASLKGIELLPGQDPWSTFWSANVLFSVSTNIANIVGNVAAPVRQVVADVSRGQFYKAGRFARGYLNALFSLRTAKDTWSGLIGELGAREEAPALPEDPKKSPSATKKAEGTLQDLATGVRLVHEHDPIRTIQSMFGTGKIAQRVGAIVGKTGLSLRILGAMDAVFSRLAREGRLAREAPSYTEYAALKAADYNKYTAQARNEEQQLKDAGVPVPYNFVQRRADELSFQARPAEQQERITRAVRRDVFQSDEGPRGFTARALAGALQTIAKLPEGKRTRDLNTKWTVAAALGYSNKVLRNEMGVDQVHPLVVRGISQGQTLVINGQDVRTGSTEQVLGEIVNALNKRQVIALKGDSWKPLKYAIGMFVRTSSQVLDMGMQVVPGVGYIDTAVGQYAGGPTWSELNQDERNQLHGTQIAATALTAGLLSALIPQMEDEPNAWIYVYGGMTDAKLREYYRGKGILPFSMRVGSKTISYKDIPGLNLILGGIGGLSDAYMVAKRTPERPLTVGNALGSAAIGSMYTATQLSMMKNLTVLSDLFAVDELKNANNASPYARAILDVMSNMASGAIPFAGAGRELERMVYGDLSRPKDIQNRMLQNIPFAKFFTETRPALNIFGKPLRANIWPGLSRFVGDAQESPQLDWLLRNGYSVALPKPGTKLTKTQQAKYSEMLASDDPSVFEDYLTEEDQHSYMQIFGPALENLLADYADRDPFGYDPVIQKRLDRDVKNLKAATKKEILSAER
jgi:hypothetical protein